MQLSVLEFTGACFAKNAKDLYLCAIPGHFADFSSNAAFIQSAILEKIRIRNVGYCRTEAVLFDETFKSDTCIVTKANARFSLETLMRALSDVSEETTFTAFKHFGKAYHFSLLMVFIALFFIFSGWELNFFHSFAFSGGVAVFLHIKTREWLLSWKRKSFETTVSFERIRKEILKIAPLICEQNPFFVETIRKCQMLCEEDYQRDEITFRLQEAESTIQKLNLKLIAEQDEKKELQSKIITCHGELTELKMKLAECDNQLKDQRKIKKSWKHLIVALQMMIQSNGVKKTEEKINQSLVINTLLERLPIEIHLGQTTLNMIFSEANKCENSELITEKLFDQKFLR